MHAYGQNDCRHVAHYAGGAGNAKRGIVRSKLWREAAIKTLWQDGNAICPTRHVDVNRNVHRHRDVEPTVEPGYKSCLCGIKASEGID